MAKTIKFTELLTKNHTNYKSYVVNFILDMIRADRWRDISI